MHEIEKLRHRLKNVGKHTAEYRMTVTEASALLTEIDKLKIELTKPAEEIYIEPVIKTRILDGGTL